LVADGSPSHQRRAQGILTGEGLEVLTVSNGVAAIKKLPTAKAALVLADVSMPGRDGYEVCDFVKNSPDLARIPVLLSYSEQTPYDEARSQRCRADGRIKKPFGQDELLNIVKRFLPAEEAALPTLAPTLRTPAVAKPAPIEPPEPMDLPPEEPARLDVPDLGALSAAPVFGEQAEESPELNPPAMSIEDAFSQAAGEAASPAEMPFAAMAETPAPAMEEPAPAAEPMLVEEPAPAAPPAEEEEEPAARTMMFRMPVQIAEPILADDTSAAPPVEELPPPPVEAAPPPAPSAEIEATTLDSYSLDAAAAGQVSLAAPPEGASEPAAAEAAPAAEASTSAAAVLDTDLVHWIVHNVVVRMAAPALSTAQVEELIRQITDEMINDLTQPPPET
jgi:CheY-like chemotaxis protein